MNEDLGCNRRVEESCAPDCWRFSICGLQIMRRYLLSGREQSGRTEHQSTEDPVQQQHEVQKAQEERKRGRGVAVYRRRACSLPQGQRAGYSV
ncbi:hypothetical protein NQZ68_036392 [Dissostichus eleginoides]|nr:hypothetical protein NQZ68_036392 [Dissostichus eleginoides]